MRTADLKAGWVAGMQWAYCMTPMLLLLALAQSAGAVTAPYTNDFTAPTLTDFVEYHQIAIDTDEDGIDDAPDGEWIYRPDDQEVYRILSGPGDNGTNGSFVQVTNAPGNDVSVKATWSQSRHSFGGNAFFAISAFGDVPQGNEQGQFYYFEADARNSEFKIRKRRLFGDGSATVDDLLPEGVYPSNVTSPKTYDLDWVLGTANGSTRRLDLADSSQEGSPLREHMLQLDITHELVPDGDGNMVPGLKFDGTLSVWWFNSDEVTDPDRAQFFETTITGYDASGNLHNGEWFGFLTRRSDSSDGQYYWDVHDFSVELLGSAGMAGDFNGDGAVDAADYVIWRKNLGATDESVLNGNGDGLNGVDSGDYNLWQTHFGGGSAAAILASAIPEPATIGMLLICGIALAITPRRRVS